MAILHFIYGLPGAGKTSLARDIAAQCSAVVFIEDEWLVAVFDGIDSLADFVRCSRRVRAMIGPLATRILENGVSVVFDFAANTARDRAWVRTVFTAARADHVLHILDVPEEECRRRVRERNEHKSDGLYFGHVSDATFDGVLPRIIPPTAEEGFTLRFDS